jgi:alkanesulfonate monooxygenase SsuD/methylene tetrahydromethanopterin reductase-like flavin-dependent oxidoreductase (luciferase family)
VLGKIITALDVVSGGRALLGIGAGWYELEHDSFGIEFGTFTERFEKLEEALQILLPMLEGKQPSLSGHHYVVSDVINQPPPVGRIPVMIGGSGEKKTLRMVAQYADESNLIAAPKDIARKLDALDDHCSRLGRDRSEITVSWLRSACIAPTMEQAEAEAQAWFDRRGFDEREREAVLSRYHVGDPDSVAAKFEEDLATGVDGFTINMPANGHIPERVSLLGETLTPRFDSGRPPIQYRIAQGDARTRRAMGPVCNPGLETAYALSATQGWRPRIVAA